MIGIDTNVLVRIAVQDNPRETKAAQAFLSGRSAEDPAFITTVVLAELAWVLDRSYGFSHEALHDVFEWVMESSNIVVEQAELVESAVAHAREVRAGIADAIIAAIATDAGATRIMTFDRDAAKHIPAMELLA
jgi:predicted nucleic-acid-binding protein